MATSTSGDPEQSNSCSSSSSHQDDLINDEKEKEHFRQVVESFRLYNYYASKRVANRLKHYRALSDAHKNYLSDFEDNCQKLTDCIKHNDQVISLILKDVDHMFENTSRDTIENEEKKESNDLKAHQDVERVYTTLKQVVRDWSSDGAKERASCYDLILNELKSLYSSETKLDEIKVLVPGAGLGRLVFEIAVAGFCAQGNEFSLHMLIVSNFILNKCRRKNVYKIYPYVNTWCNNWEFNSQTKVVHFPDVSPRELIGSSFSFTAGDFMDVYSENNSWNSVVTCFFIDTAHNIIDYIEKIWSILKPNGYWINFGPLLYHFADMPNEQSIELTYEQLKRIIKAVGFKFLKEDQKVPATYLENAKSMLKYSYECVFFVVQKPAN